MVEEEDNLEEIRKLYPHMTDEELRISRGNLRRYVEVMFRIYTRLKAEGKWPPPAFECQELNPNREAPSKPQ
jgi:hypothetical protein